jgi:hypothetical protein
MAGLQIDAIISSDDAGGRECPGSRVWRKMGWIDQIKTTRRALIFSFHAPFAFVAVGDVPPKRDFFGSPALGALVFNGSHFSLADELHVKPRGWVAALAFDPEFREALVHCIILKGDWQGCQ